MVDHNKLISALARHERAVQEKARLTKAIGDSLSECSNIAALNEASKSRSYKEIDWYDQKGNLENHISEAYTFSDDFGGGQRHLHRDEFGDFIADTGCDGCMRAWELIKDRRAISQELGAAKRLIRYYGKQALIELGGEHGR